jgi:hypothetical protein
MPMGERWVAARGNQDVVFWVRHKWDKPIAAHRRRGGGGAKAATSPRLGAVASSRINYLQYFVWYGSVNLIRLQRHPQHKISKKKKNTIHLFRFAFLGGSHTGSNYLSFFNVTCFCIHTAYPSFPRP